MTSPTRDAEYSQIAFMTSSPNLVTLWGFYARTNSGCSDQSSESDSYPASQCGGINFHNIIYNNKQELSRAKF